MLSIAIRNSIARRFPTTATPMLGRGFSNVYSEGSVAQSKGFKSVSPLLRIPRDLTELLTFRSYSKKEKAHEGTISRYPEL